MCVEQPESLGKLDLDFVSTLEHASSTRGLEWEHWDVLLKFKDGGSALGSSTDLSSMSDLLKSLIGEAFKNKRVIDPFVEVEVPGVERLRFLEIMLGIYYKKVMSRPSVLLAHDDVNVYTFADALHVHYHHLLVIPPWQACEEV
jgi:hypothetical protein